MDLDNKQYNTFEQLLNAERTSKEIDFYAKGQLAQCKLVVLTVDEQSNVKKFAAQETRKLLKDETVKNVEPDIAWKSVWNDRLIVHTLFQCMRNVNDVSKPFFPTPEALGKLLVGDEAAIVWNKYTEYKLKSNKIIAEMNKEEYAEVLKAVIKEGVNYDFLDLLTLEMLKGVISGLALQVRDLQTIISRSSLQPETSLPIETSI